MTCKTCICHNKEALNPKVHSEDEVWCMRRKRIWSINLQKQIPCKLNRSICGDCTKCDEETGER